MPKFTVLGPLLFAVAVAIPWLRSRTLENTNWTPLEIPFPLKPTNFAESEFTIDSNGVYQVVLKIDNPTEEQSRRLADCLMGWDWGHPKWGQSARGEACAEKPVISAEWRLTSLDGRVSERGDETGIANGGGFSRDFSDRQLIAFSASRGQRYLLAVRTFEDAGALAFAHPRIVVQPTGMTNEDEIVKTLGYWVLAGLAGLAGAILVARDWSRLRRRPLE
jgi:hypothetical protein